MTFLTTRPGPVGDMARMSGYAVISLWKGLSKLERRFDVRLRCVIKRLCLYMAVWVSLSLSCVD